MSENQKKAPPSDGTSRKPRRTAERAGTKSKTKLVSDGTSSSSLLIVGLGAVIVGVIVVIALVLVSGGLGGSDENAVSKADTPAPAEALRQGRTLVAASAVDPVVVEAYEDPQCVHCGTFTKKIEPLLVAGPVTDGTASFTYHDFIIFSSESLDAAIAMRVAEDMAGKFWDMQHIVFHNQDGVENGSFSRERLADMAELIGLDRDEFLAKMDDPAFEQAVLAERAKGAELGISSTPSIFIDGEMVEGGADWPTLRDAIAAAAAAE